MRKSSNKKSSLLTKYSLLYEKKPKSRVFAPLAETYRKLGMIEESLKILREGIKYHPDYTLGYIVLAHVYFDRQNYELSYNTIRPFVSKNLENITLQKLFAKVCINLGHLEEALQTFKYLLLINPRDIECAEQVKLLEDDLLISENEQIAESHLPESNPTTFEDDEEEWVQVNFNNNNDEENDEENDEDPKPSEAVEQWEVQKPSNPLEDFKEEVNNEKIQVEQHSLDDEFYQERFDNDNVSVIEDGQEEDVKEETSAPIITHTLVDLYCKQKHFDKAVEILESILELHPNDEITENKLYEVRQAARENEMPEDIADIDVNDAPIDEYQFEEEDVSENFQEEELNFTVSEEEIEKDLESELDAQFENESKVLISEALEKKLHLFLNQIKEKASEHKEHEKI